MNNDYTKYDTNGYHDSHCEGPNCNCDSRRYGYGTEFNGSAGEYPKVSVNLQTDVR